MENERKPSERAREMVEEEDNNHARASLSNPNCYGDSVLCEMLLLLFAACVHKNLFYSLFAARFNVVWQPRKRAIMRERESFSLFPD
jgi:hypothetical protein